MQWNRKNWEVMPEFLKHNKTFNLMDFEDVEKCWLK